MTWTPSKHLELVIIDELKQELRVELFAGNRSALAYGISTVLQTLSERLNAPVDHATISAGIISRVDAGKKQVTIRVRGTMQDNSLRPGQGRGGIQ